MSIVRNNNEFHIRTKNVSYVFYIYKDKYPVHLYWGKRLNTDENLEYLVEEEVVDRAAGLHRLIDEDKHIFLSDIPLEFSVVGDGLYRTPTLHARYENGNTVSVFEYDGFEIYDGKKKLEGLPGVYAENKQEAQTLEISLKDKISGLKVFIVYTAFEEYDVITRSIRYENTGKEKICLLSAQSASVDIYAPDSCLLHMHGDWLREGTVERTKIDHGRVSIESKRGSSSAMAQPFAALIENNATEEYGSVYGFSLVYSGSFQIEAERSSTGLTRINAGIQSFDFGWDLKSKETFQTPELVMVYSDAGIGKMSRLFHRIYRKRLCRGKYRDCERPMVINHFDATGTDFSEKQLAEIAMVGAKSGFEMFVLDDGWFGNAKEGVRPLGDWFVNKDKFPNGLNSLVEKVNKSGMQFGIWFEPEVVSPKSRLYKGHPNWCIGAAGREKTEMYHQLLLDFSKPEVREYIVNSISDILNFANISYVKWDFNRNFIETENQMQQHKCVLGLYEVLEILTKKYPDILFEGCSSGGGRFDPGMLYYMPQTWTSDNQKAMSRMRIQYGLSMVYPPITMTAHAGQIPIGENKKNDMLHTSAMVAMSGNFGFELDFSKLSEIEMKQTKEYAKTYKKIRHTVQFGDFYRIGSPFDDERTALEYVGEKQIVLFTYQRSSQSNGEEWRICLRGLKSNEIYIRNGKKYSGELLMNLGIRITLKSFEYESNCYIFEKM